LRLRGLLQGQSGLLQESRQILQRSGGKRGMLPSSGTTAGTTRDYGGYG